MKKHGKIKKKVCIAIPCILLLIYYLWGRAWPRRWFISSDQFLRLANPDPKLGFTGFFPEKLPVSAENPRYIYYDGFFDNIAGISFTLDTEKYQDMKEAYLAFFQEEEAEHLRDIYFWYVFDEKVTMEFLEDEGLDKLKTLFHEGVEDSYKVLAYDISASGHPSYYLRGVICNDDRNEIIIFNILDGIRNEKRDTEI